MRLRQRIFATRRRADGLFLRFDKGGWTDDVALAHIVAKTKFQSLIRADLGRDLEDFEMVEVFPSVIEKEGT